MADSDNPYNKLSEISDPEQPLIKRKNITVGEKGVRYQASVVPERNTAVFQIDGNIIKNGLKCDKLILSECPQDINLWNGHFIELKGHDIIHAIDQLEATLKNSTISVLNFPNIYARVVGRSIPSNAGYPEVERAKKRFMKSYKCELKILKNGQKDKI